MLIEESQITSKLVRRTKILSLFLMNRLFEFFKREQENKKRKFVKMPHNELKLIIDKELNCYDLDNTYSVHTRPVADTRSEPAAVVLDTLPADDAANESHVTINDLNNYYSCFSRDTACVFHTAELASNTPIAYLGSSSTIDLLTLMHNRTGHGNLRMLIEASKSKLVSGLKIKDKHIRKFIKTDKHLCDVCARAKITRASFSSWSKLGQLYFL